LGIGSWLFLTRSRAGLGSWLFLTRRWCRPGLRRGSLLFLAALLATLTGLAGIEATLITSEDRRRRPLNRTLNRTLNLALLDRPLLPGTLFWAQLIGTLLGWLHNLPRRLLAVEIGTRLRERLRLSLLRIRHHMSAIVINPRIITI